MPHLHNSFVSIFDEKYFTFGLIISKVRVLDRSIAKIGIILNGKKIFFFKNIFKMTMYRFLCLIEIILFFLNFTATASTLARVRR